MATFPLPRERGAIIVTLAFITLAIPTFATAGKSLQTSTKNFDYGSVVLGDYGVQTFTFTNSGKSTITLSETIVGTVTKGYGDFQFGIGSFCQAATLAPGESCDAVVFFTPSMYGRRSATLVVAASDGSGARVGLSGIGA